MIYQLVELLTGAKETNRLRDIVLKLCQDNEKLRLENAQLRAENRTLRRRLADADMRLLRQAESDALLIGGLYFAELPTSRRACQALGIGRRHWQRATALLQVARVHDGLRLDVTTPEEFERALRVAGERVRRDGLDVVRWRMPQYYR